MTNADGELVHLLRDDAVPPHLKDSALKHILGISASEEGIHHIVNHEDYLRTLYSFATNENQSILCETAHKCFINITSVPSGSFAVVNLMQMFAECFIYGLDNRDSKCIALKCQVLSNVSRYLASCEQLACFFQSYPESFRKLLFHFISNDFELREKYDYLALLFANLSTCSQGKKLFLNEESPYLKYILPYTTYPDSEIRRMGAAILLKNICFEIEYFKFLLEDVEILPALLLPLAGPEDLDEDEMEKLPVDLQYLGDDKQRETNPLIRVFLLESLLKFCSTRYGRMYLREKGVYYILRELHKWEKCASVLKVCEDVVEILIRDESDVGMDNLMDITIPEHLAKKFEELSVSTSEIPPVIV